MIAPFKRGAVLAYARRHISLLAAIYQTRHAGELRDAPHAKVRKVTNELQFATSRFDEK